MDTCRFRGVRFILRDAAGACCGIGFKSISATTLEQVKFPHSWNTDLREEHVSIIKVRVVWALILAASLTAYKSG